MATTDWKNAPADPDSIAAVAANGFDYRIVDADDPAVFDPYYQAESRGFLSPEQSDDQVAGAREGLAFRRFVGIYDPASSVIAHPVGTVNSWVTPMTLPGGAQIPMWAISGVTVAPTHRRRGIARAMLEGELRTAAAAGVAIAGLTVTEATIYGRYGFAPATFATDWTIETKRAGWVGPIAPGRLDLIDRERLQSELAELHARVRGSRPGEIEAWPGLWRRMAGRAPGDESGSKVRAVRYADAGGTTRGIAVYRISDDGPDYTKHDLELRYVLSETRDAYAALWRYALEHDLVAVVKAPLRSVDEPVRWMIADQRAARVDTTEHGWLRILDVPAVLTARTYAAAGSFTMRVRDPLGLAEGTWQLRIDEAGRADVRPIEADADIDLSVNALSSIVLGGVRLSTLTAAGLASVDEATAASLDRSFTSSQVPYLSLWY